MIEPTSAMQWLGFSRRVIDIVHSQSRSLRIRQWAGFLVQNPGAGILVDIGVSPADCIRRAKKRGMNIPELVSAGTFLDDTDCLAFSDHKTTLLSPSVDSLIGLKRLGRELAVVNFSLYAANMTSP